jgi:hypothetical protein
MIDNTNYRRITCAYNASQTPPPPNYDAILDSSTTGNYLTINSPVSNILPTHNGVRASIPDGKSLQASHQCELRLPKQPPHVCSTGCSVQYHESPIYRTRVRYFLLDCRLRTAVLCFLRFFCSIVTRQDSFYVCSTVPYQYSTRKVVAYTYIMSEDGFSSESTVTLLGHRFTYIFLCVNVYGHGCDDRIWREDFTRK